MSSKFSDQKGAGMTVTQANVSVKEFAKVMLEADSIIAGRVRHFEERFGPADTDIVAVLCPGRLLLLV